jgi:hypothetical protein
MTTETYEVAPGHSYYPEMGELPPACAIVEADYFGHRAYLTFLPANHDKLMAAIKATKVRFTTVPMQPGDRKMCIRMTFEAYEKFRKANREMCTSQLML